MYSNSNLIIMLLKYYFKFEWNIIPAQSSIISLIIS